jgi:hypothetical protein
LERGAWLSYDRYLDVENVEGFLEVEILTVGVMVRVTVVTVLKGIHMIIVKVLVTTLMVELGNAWEGIWRGIGYFLQGSGLVDVVVALVFRANWSVYASLEKLHWKYRIGWGKGDHCTAVSPEVKDCDDGTRSTDDSRQVNTVSGLCWELFAAEQDCLDGQDYEFEQDCWVSGVEVYLSIAEV